jgi:hypothetical protein
LSAVEAELSAFFVSCKTAISLFWAFSLFA